MARAVRSLGALLVALGRVERRLAAPARLLAPALHEVALVARGLDVGSRSVEQDGAQGRRPLDAGGHLLDRGVGVLRERDQDRLDQRGVIPLALLGTRRALDG